MVLRPHLKLFWLTCLDPCVQQVEKQIVSIDFDQYILNLHAYIYEKYNGETIQYFSVG